MTICPENFQCLVRSLPKELDFTNEMIYNILNQIHIMEAHIFIEKYDDEKYKNFIFPIIKDINTIKLSDNIIHVAKCSCYTGGRY